MALSRGMAHASVGIGFTILILTFGCIACGAVAMSKLNEWPASIGLWGIYFLIPAIILLIAGFGRYFALFAVGIGANVVGILLAIVGTFYAAAVWAVLNELCVASVRVSIAGIVVLEDSCVCRTINAYSNAESVTFGASCSDLETVRNLSAGATILYVLLFVFSFVGAILGCAGACCGNQVPRHRRGMAYPAPYVIPYGDPNTMVMTRIEQRYHYDDPYLKHDRYNGPYNDQPPYYRNDPYTKALPYYPDESYTKALPYYRNEPHTKALPYRSRDPYERPYDEVERHYNTDRGYIQEYPSSRSLRAREQPTYFVGHANEGIDDKL